MDPATARDGVHDRDRAVAFGLTRRRPSGDHEADGLAADGGAIDLDGAAVSTKLTVSSRSLRRAASGRPA
jgi:hypothetical protein